MNEQIEAFKKAIADMRNCDNGGIAWLVFQEVERTGLELLKALEARDE